MARKKKIETTEERLKKKWIGLAKSVREKKEIEMLEENPKEPVIVRTKGLCSYENFLKGLDSDKNNLISKSIKRVGETSNIFNYQFGDIAMRIWWWEEETGGLPAKLLAYIVYHYLLGIKVYTSELWKDTKPRKELENDLFPIWGKKGSKTGVVLNEYTLEEFMNEEDNYLEQQAMYSLQSSMPYVWDEPYNGDDFELVHEVKFQEFNLGRLYKLKNAFAEIASMGRDDSLLSVANGLSAVLENYYASGEYDKEETIATIEKCGGKMKEMNREQKEDFADFLNVFTSNMIPLSSYE